MTTSQIDPLLGRLVDGRYEVRSRIARGGMATVYLATDQRLERRVAIKVMHGHLSDDTTFKNRFVQEARSAARLAHPNVVSVFDQGQDSDMAYLVMEYLPGITLRDLLKERGMLTAQQTVDIMHSVLSGLAAAHRAGILHRDLKPENVLLADDGRIKIGDFGLARAASANTASGQALLGTIAYLSPELVTRGTADTRSDIYAIGIMLYEMLTGEQPFTGEQPMQIAYQHANDSVPYPSAKVPSVPQSLDELVLWATERDPDMRPRDAGVMLAQLLEAERLMGVTPTDRRGETQATVVAPALEIGDTTVFHGDALLAASPAASETTAVGRLEPSDPVEALTATTTKRRRRGVILVVLVLLVALLGGGVAWWVGETSPIDIPDVTNQQADAARDQLVAAGFEVVEESANDLTMASGLVLRTDPPSGEQRSRGSSVTLVVSAGPRILPVPDVVGSNLEDAKATIAADGFVAGAVTSYFDAEIAANVVMRAQLPDGSDLPASLAEQSTIDLVRSLGPVPNVVGLTEDEASTALKDAGLAMDKSAAEFSDDVPSGSIISQTNPEDPASPGDIVTVTVSKGPDVVAVPDVEGMTRDAAKAALEAAGFVVVIPDGVPVILYTWTTLPNGYTNVVGTTPSIGESIRRGSSVTLDMQVRLS
ncbi:Stk1 family PASTA domain-containing Ser/Thr kinase [Microbacteriaceae bacterium VKM Ac-2855]|nr:Stk1 family PASTA domain-containing Ser/Thr kinase [Microbacteriaceae bacterium VKM Ac-2855]